MTGQRVCLRTQQSHQENPSPNALHPYGAPSLSPVKGFKPEHLGLAQTIGSLSIRRPLREGTLSLSSYLFHTTLQWLSDSKSTHIVAKYSAKTTGEKAI